MDKFHRHGHDILNDTATRKHQNATGQTTPCSLLVFIKSYVTAWTQTIKEPIPIKL